MKEPTAAKIVAALDVLNRAQDLLHAAQTIADANTLRRKNRGAGIIRGARPDRQQQFRAIVMAQAAIFLDFLTRVTEHAIGLGHAIDGDAVLGGRVQQGPHGFRRVHCGNFDPEGPTIREAQRRAGHIEQVARRQSKLLEVLTSLFKHVVFSFF